MFSGYCSLIFILAVIYPLHEIVITSYQTTSKGFVRHFPLLITDLSQSLSFSFQLRKHTVATDATLKIKRRTRIPV